MMANRRNLIFRVSIVINIAVLLYAAMQLSGNNLNNSWDEPDRAFDLRYLTLTRPEGKNDSNVKFVRFYDELTSQNSPTTMATVTNKTTSTSSTISMVEVLKKLEVLKKVEDLNMTLSQNESVIDRVDENELSNTTLSKLADLLGCHQRDFERRLVQRGEFWVMQNFVQADHGQIECHESVTYTTHAGFEFLDNIPPLVERWMGPISIAIHAPGTDFQRSLNSIRYLRECLNHEYVKQFVTFHIFFSNKHIPDKIPESYDFLDHHYECPSEPPYVVGTSANNASYKKKKGLLYPVNVARNVARDAALTHFILPSDIELYPSPNIIARFLNMIARNEKPLNTSTKPRVFPISIFEVDAKNRVPLSKTELQTMLKNKSAIPFHKFVCSNCHNIPQGIQWMKAAETKQMGVFHIGKRKGRFIHWEPIFIGTHQDPYYDERLSWEGKQDKMTQGYILCVKDYDFMILNNAFLTHKPGIKHYAKDPKRDSIAGKQSSFNKNVVIPELKKLFGYRQGCGL